MDDQIFYVGQKALIVKDDKILVLYRDANTPDLPGGKVQIGELDLAQSLQREVREETGLEIEVGPIVGARIVRFRESSLIGNQKKTEYLYMVLHTVMHWSGEIRLSSEHMQYKWLGKDDYAHVGDDMKLLKHIMKEYFQL